MAIKYRGPSSFADARGFLRSGGSWVEFGPGGPTPTPSGDFSDGYDTFGFEGIESATTSTHLKNGTSMGSGVGSMKYYFDAYMTALMRDNAITGISALDTRSLETFGRAGGRAVEYGINVLRLTGHLPILDRLIEGMNRTKTNFVVPFGPEYDCAAFSASGYQSCCGGSDGNPWSPFPKLMYIGSETRWRGTDTHRQDPQKYIGVISQIAWALHMNRGKVSPAGYNYATEADYWAERVEDYVDAWSMGPWPPTDCWRYNYRGCNGSLGFHPERDDSNFPGLSYGRRRAPHGVWPIACRNAGHVPLSMMLAHRSIGLLGMYGRKAGGAPLSKIINGDTAMEQGALAIVDLFLDNHPDGTEDKACDSYGRPTYLPLGSILGGSRPGPTWMTYTGNNNTHYLSMWLSGAYRGTNPSSGRERYTRSRMLRYARAMADAVKSDGSTYSALGGPVDYCGHGLDTRPDGGGRSISDSMTKAIPGALIWADETEPGGMRLWDAATAGQNSAGGGYGSNCRGPYIPAAQFVRRALDAVGDLD